jgi:hypothetical protein
MATGPGFYDNLCPQSWQDGSAATFTLNDPHQQSKNPCSNRNLCHRAYPGCFFSDIWISCGAAFDCPGN